MTLYHYTDVFRLAGIARAGISKGEVAVTPVHVVNFPWFTSEFSLRAQEDWIGYNRSKRTLRLEVKFDESDERLVQWREYARRLRLTDEWYEKMTGPNVSLNGRTWFVFRGIVPFEWVKTAYFHPTNERVNLTDLRRAAEIIHALELQSEPALPCQHLTEEEAFALTHQERMAGHSKPVAAALADVAQNNKLKSFDPPEASSFIEYVERAADLYRKSWFPR